MDWHEKDVKNLRLLLRFLLDVRGIEAVFKLGGEG